jgi:hypothetical protein
MCWVSGYLQLRNSRDLRDLVCVNPAQNGMAFCGAAPFAELFVNTSIGYRGDLTVIAVPKGWTFAVTLSDAPIVRPPMTPEWNFSGANYTPVNPPAAKKPHGTARKAEAILQAARTPA